MFDARKPGMYDRAQRDSPVPDWSELWALKPLGACTVASWLQAAARRYIGQGQGRYESVRFLRWGRRGKTDTRPIHDVRSANGGE